MKSIPNTDLFETMPVPIAAMRLMVPTMIGSLVTILYNLADTFFVGFLNDAIQTSAVSLASPALLSFYAVNNLFGVGSSSMMSRSLGKKDTEAVRQSASFGFYGAIFSGLAISVFSCLFMSPLVKLLGAEADTANATTEYIKYAVSFGAVPSILNVVLSFMVRSEGNSLHASIGTMSGCVLNIILDPIFILPFGLNMGASGAGLATFLSNCVACVYFFVLLFIKKRETNINLHPKYFTLKREIVVGITSVGIPVAIQNLLNVTGMTILNNLVAGYGAVAVAGMGIAQKIHTVPVQISMGTTQGVMPLVGYTYSSKNAKRFSETINFVRKLLLPVMIFVSVLCFVFAGQIVKAFIQDENVIAYGKIFLRGLASSLPFMLLDFMAVGVFASIGMGKMALLFAILRKIVLEIPAIIALNAIFHANGIAYSALVAETVLAVFGTIMLRKIKFF